MLAGYNIKFELFTLTVSDFGTLWS